MGFSAANAKARSPGSLTAHHHLTPTADGRNLLGPVVAHAPLAHALLLGWVVVHAPLALLLGSVVPLAAHSVDVSWLPDFDFPLQRGMQA
jgi:hypothetical protein